MKQKFIIPAAIAALMGVGAFFGHANSTPPDGLTDLQLANVEALAEDELWDTSCEKEYGAWCVLGPYSIIHDAKGNNDPSYPVY